jgi:lipoyl-dependent peroxiredoxin
MKRTATAVWTGSLKEGKGSLTTGSGALSSSPSSFASRFESAKATNPEELIASAHAGCFAMAFSAALGEAGLKPDRIEVKAEVGLENIPPAGWTIATSQLTLTAKVPGIDAAKFQEIAEKAKAGCPVSRVLNLKITLSATLTP